MSESREPRYSRIDVTDGTLIPARDQRSVFSAWRLSFYGAILLLAGLLIFKPEPYLKIALFIPDGIVVTFIVTTLSITFALIIGLFAGLGQVSRIGFVNRISTVYVEVVRGIPLLVQLFYIYFALGKFLKLQGLPAAVISMSFCYGAYLAEIFRAGIQAVPKGQIEAALALGMTRTQAMWKIIIPQTIRVILPPIGNEFIALLKDSSLVSILAISDLLRRGREYASVSFEYFEAYTIVALVYLVITLFLSRLVGMMEDRINRHGK